MVDVMKLKRRWRVATGGFVAGILAFALVPSYAYAQNLDLRLSTTTAPVGDSLSVSAKCDLKADEKSADITVWIGDQGSSDTWKTTTKTGDWSLDIKVPDTDAKQLAVHAKCKTSGGQTVTYKDATLKVGEKGQPATSAPATTTTKPTSTASASKTTSEPSKTTSEPSKTTSEPSKSTSTATNSSTAKPCSGSTSTSAVPVQSPTSTGVSDNGGQGSPCSRTTSSSSASTSSSADASSSSPLPCTTQSGSSTSPTSAGCAKTPTSAAPTSTSSKAVKTTEALSGKFGKVTLSGCIVTIPVTTTGDGTWTVQVWDDRVAKATYTITGSGTKNLTWKITEPAGTKAPGVDFVLKTNGVLYDQVVEYSYPASVANNCSAAVAVSIDLPDYTGSTKPGAKQGITGKGYLPGETVDLDFGGVKVGTAVVGTDGTFKSSFTVPSVTAAGDFTVTATGQTSGRAATASVKVTVTSQGSTWSLADTGSGVPAVLAAAGLLLAIAGAVLIRRRKSKA